MLPEEDSLGPNATGRGLPYSVTRERYRTISAPELAIVEIAPSDSGKAYF
jgi:hypothetical protein